MALNPDDLLIFKVREEEEPEETKKAKKPEPQPSISQKIEQPKQQPKPSFFAQKQQKHAEPKEPTYIAPPKMDESVILDQSLPSPEDTVEAALEVTFPTATQRKGEVKKQHRHSLDPKKLAEHLSCELHPWRRAYALCNYCKRAFCYEDIVESGGKFYCLDDIDKVPEAQRRSQIVRYNNLSLLSSVLFMLVFLVFVYYSYMQILTLFSNLSRLGLGLFINDISTSQIYLIIGLGIAIVSFIAAVMILLNSGSSFRLSSFVGFATVILFSYQYITIDKFYLVIMAAFSFVALVTLAYSRVSYESLPDGDGMFDGDPLSTAKSSF